MWQKRVIAVLRKLNEEKEIIHTGELWTEKTFGVIILGTTLLSKTWLLITCFLLLDIMF